MELKTIESITPVEPNDLSKYKFIDYARDNYRDESPSSHKRGSLIRPLHFQTNKHSYEASLTMFHVIQRFMFDLPEPQSLEADEEDNVFLRTLERNSGGFDEARTIERKVISIKAPGFTSIPTLTTMSRPTTNMEKVRFICSYGIYCPDMRDEIYNQICIQLINNPSKTSTSRGWILLAVCLGCFLPSEKFLNYLWNFIKQGPEAYSSYCEQKLHRTMSVGNRKLTPALLELHAARVQGKIMLPVTTMDAVSYEFEVDSSTTCEELLNSLKNKLGLKNIFGFSVYARQYDQVFNWGSGGDNIMDVVCLCEQYAIHKNIPDEDNHWSIFVRKDMFLSSHDANEDPIETALIYAQIMGGIHVGEYRCSTNDELADLLARRYYVDNGKIIEDEKLGKIIEFGTPPEVDTQDHMQLTRLIREKFSKIQSIVNLATVEIIKKEVVDMVKSKKAWSKNFSRIFNARLISGPKVPKGDVRVFLHSSGIDLLGTSTSNGKEAFFLNLSFDHITLITNDSPEYMKIKGGRFNTNYYLTIRTRQKSTYTLTSVNAPDIFKLGNVLFDDFHEGNTFL